MKTPYNQLLLLTLLFMLFACGSDEEPTTSNSDGTDDPTSSTESSRIKRVFMQYQFEGTPVLVDSVSYDADGKISTSLTRSGQFKSGVYASNTFNRSIYSYPRNSIAIDVVADYPNQLDVTRTFTLTWSPDSSIMTLFRTPYCTPFSDKFYTVNDQLSRWQEYDYCTENDYQESNFVLDADGNVMSYDLDNVFTDPEEAGRLFEIEYTYYDTPNPFYLNLWILMSRNLGEGYRLNRQEYFVPLMFSKNMVKTVRTRLLDSSLPGGEAFFDVEVTPTYVDDLLTSVKFDHLYENGDLEDNILFVEYESFTP